MSSCGDMQGGIPSKFAYAPLTRAGEHGPESPAGKRIGFLPTRERQAEGGRGVRGKGPTAGAGGGGGPGTAAGGRGPMGARTTRPRGRRGGPMARRTCMIPRPREGAANARPAERWGADRTARPRCVLHRQRAELLRSRQLPEPSIMSFEIQLTLPSKMFRRPAVQPRRTVRRERPPNRQKAGLSARHPGLPLDAKAGLSTRHPGPPLGTPSWAPRSTNQRLTGGGRRRRGAAREESASEVDEFQLIKEGSIARAMQCAARCDRPRQGRVWNHARPARRGSP